MRGMSMNYKLGLDLGTASIGAVTFSLDTNNQPSEIIWHFVRTFDEPTDKGQTGRTPKKAARRLARQQRKQIDRKASRLRRIAHLASLIDLDRGKILADNGQNLPRLRAEAVDQKVPLEDLLRICLKLGKRRGYKGQFRVKASDGEVKAGVEQITLLMEKDGHKTVGQYLYDRLKRGLPAKLKIQEIISTKKRKELIENDAESYNLYVTRDMLENEFDLIWNTQAKFFPVLNNEYLGKPVKEHFYQAIFFQRPLKSPTPMVGNCSLISNLPRAPRAQLSFQNFRIEKQIADLRWGMRKKSQPLSADQKICLRKLLNDPDKLTKEGKLNFKKFYSELEEVGIEYPARNLNMDRQTKGGREELQGNRTLKNFSNLGLLNEWDSLTSKHQISIINFLADLGSPEQLDDDQWHTQIKGAAKGKKAKLRKFEPEVISFIDQLRQHEKFNRLTSMGFDGGRAPYSIKALDGLNSWLSAPYWKEKPVGNELPRIDEEAAIEQCFGKQTQTQKSTDRLDSIPITGNDVVDVALRQIKYVINQCIDQHGPPKQIVIELSRDMGKSIQQRNEIEKRGRQNQTARDNAKKEIGKLNLVPTNNLIRRYLLWQEQVSRCPYCTNKLELEQAMHGGETHYEHILPRSLTQIGLKYSEIVLSHKNCNELKGNRTPREAFANDAQRWGAVEHLAQHFKQRKLYRKAQLLLIDNYEDDTSINDFSDRQGQETSWISKTVAQWMRSICDDVFVSRGQLTARLRHIWHLETVIPDVRIEEGYPVLDTDGKIISTEDYQIGKYQWEGRSLPAGIKPIKRSLDKRIDHRHHLIDAITIAMISRSLYMNMARQYKQDQLKLEEFYRLGKEHRTQNDRPEPSWSIEPPSRKIRDQALAVIRDCNISHKPDRHSSGAIYKDTAYSITTDENNNKSYLALRMDLKSLVNEKSLEKTLKNFQSIISPGIRQIVSKAVEKGFNNLQETLSRIEHPQYSQSGKPVYIKKVKCNRNYSIETAEMILFGKSNQHKKYLQDAGNAYLEIALNEDKTKVLDSRLVTMPQAARGLQPIAEHTIKFFKGDTLLNKKNERLYIIKQIKSASGGTLFLVPIVETRPVSELDKKENSGILLRASVKKLINFTLVNDHV